MDSRIIVLVYSFETNQLDILGNNSSAEFVKGDGDNANTSYIFINKNSIVIHNTYTYAKAYKYILL